MLVDVIFKRMFGAAPSLQPPAEKVPTHKRFDGLPPPSPLDGVFLGVAAVHLERMVATAGKTGYFVFWLFWLFYWLCAGGLVCWLLLWLLCLLCFGGLVGVLFFCVVDVSRLCWY